MVNSEHIDNSDSGDLLFDDALPVSPRKEWRDMPEFVQDKQGPFCQIVVRFGSESDLVDFAKIMGCRLTSMTKSMWFPCRSHWGGEHTKKGYIDEP